MLELRGLEPLGVVQHHLADLQRSFLRHGQQPRGEDVHARLEIEQARRLVKRLDLDLREETDRNRSALLHRLRLLGVDWGVPDTTGARGKGTFHELWKLRWDPAFTIKTIHRLSVTRLTRFARRVPTVKEPQLPKPPDHQLMPKIESSTACKMCRPRKTTMDCAAWNRT